MSTRSTLMPRNDRDQQREGYFGLLVALSEFLRNGTANNGSHKGFR